jgi:hypothetical protein
LEVRSMANARRDAEVKAFLESLGRRVKGMTRDEAEVELRDELKANDGLFVTFDSRVAFRKVKAYSRHRGGMLQVRVPSDHDSEA